MDRKTALVGQNLKYDYKVLVRWGIADATLHFDTMIAAWLLDSSSGVYNMDYLADKYLGGYQTVRFIDVVPDKDGSFADVPLEQAVRYAAEDSDITWRLYEVLAKELEGRSLTQLFERVEMPLVKILSKMELAGIRLEQKRLEEFDSEIVQRLGKIEQEIYDEVGHPFNINSTKQLQEVLFEERKLPTGKKNKTGFSTATDTLEQLAPFDSVPRLILMNRGLVKLKNTYIDTLPLMINRETGRIHTSFTQTGTATGRLSSRNPNLQNIPIRNDDGRRIRDAFVPAPDHLFLSADYSQIELVVLAHLADDPGPMRRFFTAQDIHTHTAGHYLQSPPELVVCPTQRRIRPDRSTSSMYGMSDVLWLSKRVADIQEDAATVHRYDYQRVHPVSAAFMDGVLWKVPSDTRGFHNPWQGNDPYRRFLGTGGRQGAERSSSYGA